MESTPISLYVDLEDDSKADIETIARSALAFSAAIREAAFVIDPSLDIRIDFVSGTEGSISLNTLVKSIKIKDILSKRNLIAVALLSLLWFRKEIPVWGFQKVMDYIIIHEEASKLSKEDQEIIAAKVIESLETRIAQQKVERVYRELEHDSAVRGVGATTTPGKRPEQIVPRSEFAARSRAEAITEEHVEVTKRVRTTIETVTLISPMLMMGKRKWKFIGQEGEFSAEIKDHEFLDDLLYGRMTIPMVIGIQMEIEMNTSEEKKDGAWNVNNRTIIKVRRIMPPQIQGQLRFPSSKSGN